MKRQAGFTLIEAMVAGVISTILAGSILSVLYMCNDRIKESMAMAKLTMMYDVVSEAFHRAAREASTIGGNTETPPLSTLSAPFTGLGRITFYDSSGAATGGFAILGDGYLREWKSGSFQTFKIGVDSIYVPDFHFSILTDRNAARFRLTFSMTSGGKTYVLTNPRETAQCRNNMR